MQKTLVRSNTRERKTNSQEHIKRSRHTIWVLMMGPGEYEGVYEQYPFDLLYKCKCTIVAGAMAKGGDSEPWQRMLNG